MSLELKELSEEERIALVALLQRVIAVDGRTGDEEAEHLRAVVAAIGKKSFQQASAIVDERFVEDEQLWNFVATVTRREARALIYESVLEAVLADVPHSDESQVLQQLSKLWHISPRVIPE